MPIISTVIKTVTISLLCQNSLSVGAARKPAEQAFNFDKISSQPRSLPLACVLGSFTKMCLPKNFYTELKIINRSYTEWEPFKNISAFYITCHLLSRTKYFGLKRKVAGGVAKVQEFKASSCALSLLWEASLASYNDI